MYNSLEILQVYKLLDPKSRLDLIPKHFIEKYTTLQTYVFKKAAIVYCEHRSFHLMAINSGARIRIAPEVIFPFP